MNTRASVAYGWGILCLAGGGAYYFAKRSINSDRAERAAAQEQQRQDRERARRGLPVTRDDKLSEVDVGHSEKSASKAKQSQTADLAAVEHTPPPVESKYQAKEPYRSRKGDRFS